METTAACAARPALAKLDAGLSGRSAASASHNVRKLEKRREDLRAELAAAHPDVRWQTEWKLEDAEENLRFARADVQHHRAEALDHERRYRRELGRDKPSPSVDRSTIAIVRTARARGAGRPRAVARASSRGGDSGDDSSGSSEGDGEPAAARPLNLDSPPDRRELLEALAARLTALEIPRDDPWGHRNVPVVWWVRRHLCWRLERIEGEEPAEEPAEPAQLRLVEDDPPSDARRLAA